MAGFHELLAVEWDQNAVDTFHLNFPDVPVYHGDIAKLTGDECMKLAGIEKGQLDVLDGSPPCSSFSMAGNREKDWGKDKVFREGQAMQILDTLFFDFIDLAKELQPKVVVAENVKGLLLGDAKQYVIKIYREFDKAGYYVQHWLLDASKMGVPQRR